MGLDPDALDALAKRLRELAKAQRDSLRWTDRCGSDMTPRRGPRGGRNTTLNARWSIAAEYRDRLFWEVQSEAVQALDITAATLDSPQPNEMRP